MANAYYHGFTSHRFCINQEVALCVKDTELLTGESKIICGVIKGGNNFKQIRHPYVTDCTPNVSLTIEVDDALLVDPKAGLKCEQVCSVSPDKCFLTS